MIKGIPARTAELSTDEVCWVDNEEHVFLMFRIESGAEPTKIKGKADIIKLRDLLNEAYPPKMSDLHKIGRERLHV